MTIERSCKKCIFWVFEDNGSNMSRNLDGHCKRYPPTLDTNYYLENEESATEESAWYGFPITNDESWCGEYK